MGEILVMGPNGSGKTTLLKRLLQLVTSKSISPFDPIELSEPTDEMISITLRTKRSTFVVKELGGSSITDFTDKASTATGIVYVFDGADFVMTATNIVWLQKVLESDLLENRHLLILLSKCDVPGAITFDVINEMIDLNNLTYPDHVSFATTSAVNGVNVTEILKWITQTHTIEELPEKRPKTTTKGQRGVKGF